MASNDNNTVQDFTEAAARFNGFIPSLHSLAVETIKTFVNPSIKELEKVLLEDSERIFTQNNDLRCTAEEDTNAWLQDISGEVGTIYERTERLEKEMCGEGHIQMSLYDRVSDIQSEVDDIKTELKIISENINRMAENIVNMRIAVTKPKRKRKREDNE